MIFFLIWYLPDFCRSLHIIFLLELVSCHCLCEFLSIFMFARLNKLHVVYSIPLLYIHTAKLMESDVSNGELYCSFGQRLQTNVLNDLFEFWVLPCLHLSRKTSFVSRINNGCTTSIIALVSGHFAGLYFLCPAEISLWHGHQLFSPFLAFVVFWLVYCTGVVV